MNDRPQPGIYWNGKSLAHGFWLVQSNGKVYFSGTPVAESLWSSSYRRLEGLKYLCSLDGEMNDQAFSTITLPNMKWLQLTLTEDNTKWQSPLIDFRGGVPIILQNNGDEQR